MKYNITKKLKTAQAADFLTSELGMTSGGSKGGGGGSAGGSGSGSGSSNVAPATQNSTGAANNKDRMLQIIINIAENLEQVGAITTTKSEQIANSDNIQAQLQIIVPIIRSILENKAQNGPAIVNVAANAATALGQTIPQGSASAQGGAQRGSLGQLSKFTQGKLYEGPAGPPKDPGSFNWVGLLVGDNAPTERWDRGGNGTEVTELDASLPIYMALYRWRGKTVVSGPSNPPLPVGYGYNQMITLKASEGEDEETGEPYKEGPFKAPAAVYWGPEPLKNTRSENENKIGYYVYELSTKNTDGFGWIEVNETIITGAGLRVANVTPEAPSSAAAAPAPAAPAAPATAPAPAPAATPAAAPAPAPAPAAITTPANLANPGVTLGDTSGIDLSKPVSL